MGVASHNTTLTKEIQMTIRETELLHSEMVNKLFKPGEAILDSLTAGKCEALHAAIGIATEGAGELLDAVAKRYVIYNKDLDLKNVIEELGDMEFYLEAIRQNLGITREETLIQNRNKLLTAKNARYKEGTYSDKAAHERSDKNAVEEEPTTQTTN